jgi:tyrosinase
MSSLNGIRIRRSIESIYNDYLIGQKSGSPALQKPLNDLIRAWKGIIELGHTDPNSFFNIGSLHGEPFRGGGYGSAAWWGGWCNHGNILFPTWHRAYCLGIEDALRTIEGCEDVALPYWDETGPETAENGVPEIFLQPKFLLNGEYIDNPLYSYKFAQNIVDNISGDKSLYSKYKGYNTVRYPYSGLVGTEEVRMATLAYNREYYSVNDTKASTILCTNVKAWLQNGTWQDGKWQGGVGVRQKFFNCLDAPNYTVFSNTTSAQAWNDNAPPEKQVMPLEAPHNDIHLAVGGFEVPGQEFSPILGANGDMGENDTASFDPIFYFHHCFIDRCFWLWQVKHECTDYLEVIAQYPGTNSVDNQGPTPGVAGGTWLTLESPLQPFKKPGSGNDRGFYTSNDVANIEKQLGYTYDAPGNAGRFLGGLPDATHATHSVRISGLNKNNIAGSHQLVVYGLFPGETERRVLAVESVLSRWHVSGCKNCQTTSDVKRHVQLHGLPDGLKAAPEGSSDGDAVQVSVEVVTRDGSGPGRNDPPLKPIFKVVGSGEKYSDT